jgi:hypothetical protein
MKKDDVPVADNTIPNDSAPVQPAAALAEFIERLSPDVMLSPATYADFEHLLMRFAERRFQRQKDREQLKKLAEEAFSSCVGKKFLRTVPPSQRDKWERAYRARGEGTESDESEDGKTQHDISTVMQGEVASAVRMLMWRQETEGE